MTPRPSRLSPLLAGALIWLLLAAPGRAQSSGVFPAMAMSVRPSRTEYWLGEPVVLECRLVNWYSPMLTVSAVFGLHGEDTELRIVRRGVESDPYLSHFRPGVITPKETLLPYAKALEWELEVLYDRNAPSTLALAEPGEYAIKVTQQISVTDMLIEPNPRSSYGVTAYCQPSVRVVAPPDETAGALELLRSRPDAIRDLARRFASIQNRALFERIAREYPDSRYAPYCLDAMARQAHLAGRDVGGETERATRLFEQLVARYPDYPYRDRIRVILAESYLNDGRGDAGAAIARQLVAESEDNLMRFRDYDAIVPLRGRQPNPYFTTNLEHWYLFPTTRLTDAYFQVQIEVGSK